MGHNKHPESETASYRGNSVVNDDHRGHSKKTKKDKKKVEKADVVTIHKRVPASIDPAMAVRHNRCDTAAYLSCLSVFVGGLVLLFEGVAFHRDLEWNRIVAGESAFPILSEDDYFHRHILHLDTNIAEVRSIQESLYRPWLHEALAMGFVSIFIIITLISLLTYSQGETDQTFLGGIQFGGFILMAASAVLILISTLHMDNLHRETIKKLDRYSSDLKLDMPHPPIDWYYRERIPWENWEILKMQVPMLTNIQRSCVHENRWDDQYLVTINNRVYTMSNLMELRFCSSVELKFAAIFACFLYALLCAILGIYICSRTKSVPDRAQVSPSGPPPETKAMDLTREEEPEEDNDGQDELDFDDEELHDDDNESMANYGNFFRQAVEAEPSISFDSFEPHLFCESQASSVMTIASEVVPVVRKKCPQPEPEPSIVVRKKCPQQPEPPKKCKKPRDLDE